MASATFTKFNSFVADMAAKKHNLTADAIKCVLCDVAPVVTNTVLANLTQIANGGGYTGGAGGGYAITTTSATQVAGVWRLILADKVITAVGAAIAQFRYWALYNDTATNDELIGFYDYGSEVNIPDTLTFTIDFDGTNGVCSIP